MSNCGVEEFDDDIVLDHPVAVLGEDRVVPHGVFDGQADEPAKQQVVVDLLDELSLAAHAVEYLQQHGPHELLGRDARVAWRGERRSNDTHESKTDPDSLLYRKSSAAPALPSFLGHVATDCHDIDVTPHVAQNLSRVGGSSIDGLTTRQIGYDISQRKRKCIEHCFGWAKTIGPMRQVMVRGLDKVNHTFTLTMATYNLTRLRNLAALGLFICGFFNSLSGNLALAPDVHCPARLRTDSPGYFLTVTGVGFRAVKSRQMLAAASHRTQPWPLPRWAVSRAIAVTRPRSLGLVRAGWIVVDPGPE